MGTADVSSGCECTAPYLYCCTAGRQGTCNQEVYHHTDPPSYHLSDIHPSTRIALFSGKCITLGETYRVDRGGQTLYLQMQRCCSLVRYSKCCGALP
jgi:hypothetical protein